MGVDRQKETLLENTRRFAKGLPANNALLWGSRGAGKSSIVKAVHAHVNREMGGPPGPLALVEIHREDIPSLPALLGDDPQLARAASWCSATTSRSTARTPPTSR